MALLDWMSADVGLRVEGDGVMLRPPQGRRLRRLVGAAPPLARLPAALGADLAGGRPVARRLPPAADRPISATWTWAWLSVPRLPRATTTSWSAASPSPTSAAASPRWAPIGYWVGEPFARQRLHPGGGARRLPTSRSGGWACTGWRRPASRERTLARRLLLKAGFELEGRAPAYLKINGDWRDHLLFGLVAGGAAARQSGRVRARPEPAAVAGWAWR